MLPLALVVIVGFIELVNVSGLDWIGSEDGIY